MKRKAAILRGAAGIMAFLFFLCTAATTLTFHYAGVINQALGVSTRLSTATTPRRPARWSMTTSTAPTPATTRRP